MNESELIEYRRRFEELKKRHDLMIDMKAKKCQKEAEKRLDQERDKFIRNLFGPSYDWINRLESYCRIDADDAMPSTSTGRQTATSTATPNDTKDKNDVKPFTWREFMGIPKEEDEKTTDEHAYIVAMDEIIKKKHKANKLSEVPKKAIKQVLDKKKIIKEKVDAVLMRYLEKGKINKKQYEVICKGCTRDCFENDVIGECHFCILIFCVKIQRIPMLIYSVLFPHSRFAFDPKEY